MFQIRYYTGKKKDLLLGNVNFAPILFCFTFVSYLMDIPFVIASPLFHVGHLLHVGLTDVEMYSVTVMRIVIEFCKRSIPVLHLFQIRWTFVLS